MWLLSWRHKLMYECVWVCVCLPVCRLHVDIHFVFFLSCTCVWECVGVDGVRLYVCVCCVCVQRVCVSCLVSGGFRLSDRSVLNSSVNTRRPRAKLQFKDSNVSKHPKAASVTIHRTHIKPEHDTVSGKHVYYVLNNIIRVKTKWQRVDKNPTFST